MKEYIKPVVEVVTFATEVIAFTGADDGGSVIPDV